MSQTTMAVAMAVVMIVIPDDPSNTREPSVCVSRLGVKLRVQQSWKTCPGSLYLHQLTVKVAGVSLLRQHPLGIKSLQGSGRRLLPSLLFG